MPITEERQVENRHDGQGEGVLLSAQGGVNVYQAVHANQL